MEGLVPCVRLADRHAAARRGRRPKHLVERMQMQRVGQLAEQVVVPIRRPRPRRRLVVQALAMLPRVNHRHEI